MLGPDGADDGAACEDPGRAEPLDSGLTGGLDDELTTAGAEGDKALPS